MFFQKIKEGKISPIFLCMQDISDIMASLVAQWLRICLPMQGARVRALVCAPQLLSLRSRAREPQLLSLCATTTEARTSRARAPQQKKPLQ